MKDSEFSFPSYPALSSALVVESRFSFRTEFDRDLKGTGLFVEVRSAASLASAKLSLELENIDLCLLGSGVSKEALIELLSWAPHGARTKDIGFVVVGDREQEPERDLTKHGAHAQVFRPINKAKLFDAVVRAIVAANKNSPWASIFKNADFHKQFESEIICPLLAEPSKRAASELALSEPESALGLSSLRRATAEEVERIFKERNLVFKKNGEPTQELRDAALLLLDTLFPHGAPENERFVRHCTKAVYAWFENAPLGGIKEANEQLRMSVLQFRG